MLAWWLLTTVTAAPATILPPPSARACRAARKMRMFARERSPATPRSEKRQASGAAAEDGACVGRCVPIGRRGWHAVARSQRRARLGPRNVHMFIAVCPPNRQRQDYPAHTPPPCGRCVSKRQRRGRVTAAPNGRVRQEGMPRDGRCARRHGTRRLMVVQRQHASRRITYEPGEKA